MNKKALVLAGCLAVLSVPVVSWADTSSAQTPVQLQQKFSYRDDFGYKFNAAISNDGYMNVELVAPVRNLGTNDRTYLVNLDNTENVEVSNDDTTWRQFSPDSFIPTPSKPIFMRVPVENGAARLEITVPSIPEQDQILEAEPHFWMTLHYSAEDGFSLHDDH